jgi:hypothetical protein
MLTIEFLNEEEDVVFTTHGEERRVSRDGKKVGVPTERIRRIIESKADLMKSKWPKYDTFLLKNPIDGLNVVVELYKQGKDWTFRVITLMFKYNFIAKPSDYVIKVYESMNLMMYESFMDSYESVFEIASEGGDLFDYEQLDNGEEGIFSWEIKITDADEIIHEIILNIEYKKDPSTGGKMEAWKSMFEDILECLMMIDGENITQVSKLRNNFDYRKWSGFIDIAEVSMLSKRNDMPYEPTGLGKAIALKLLRTRFHIIRKWINVYKPDAFISLPKKEDSTDTRRLRIYELYFKKYLPDYRIFARDMSSARRWFSTDTLVCLSNRIDDKAISMLEQEVDEAIYHY